MIAERVYWVTGGEAEPWRVALREDNGAWHVRVERAGAAHAFTLAAAGVEGRTWCGDRPLRFHWEPGADGAGRLVLHGLAHPLQVRTEAEQRLASLALAGPTARHARDVHAPMPGLVLAIEVEEGTVVAEGAGLAIIEAMKMENEITAPIAGRVRDVSVAPGQAVERGALLCRVEPAPEGT